MVLEGALVELDTLLVVSKVVLMEVVSDELMEDMVESVLAPVLEAVELADIEVGGIV